MHELSIAQSVIEQVEETARNEKATRVLTVTLSIGTLSGVEREALEFVFPMAAEGTLADGAALRVETIQAKLKCRACQTEADARIPLLTCAQCGSGDVEISGGRDLFIKSVELET
jgi:hydrogenase nickel incorporation protein HypA/HybF